MNANKIDFYIFLFRYIEFIFYTFKRISDLKANVYSV